MYISHILSRNECINYVTNEGDLYFKDVSILSRKDTIIIDNLIVSFASNLKSGVLVNSYNGANDDEELFELKDYIDYLYSPPEISPIEQNEEFFCFSMLYNNIFN